MYMPFLPAICGVLAGAPFPVPGIAVVSGWTVGQTVQTTSGPVGGHAALHASDVSEYLNIPNYTDRLAAAVPMLIGTTDNENGLFRVYVEEPLPDEAWIEQNQKLFDCPTAARANTSVQQGNPTWRYRYFGVFPNLVLYDQN